MLLAASLCADRQGTLLHVILTRTLSGRHCSFVQGRKLRLRELKMHSCGHRLVRAELEFELRSDSSASWPLNQPKFQSVSESCSLLLLIIKTMGFGASLEEASAAVHLCPHTYEFTW